MAISGKQPRVVISNLLVDIAISLVVNFSNFIYLLSLNPDAVPHRMTMESAG